MEKLGLVGKFLSFVYKQLYLRFSGQIRDPYLIRIDDIYTNSDTNQLEVSFHIANKRIGQIMAVSDFIAKDMIYMVDPRIVFDMSSQYGMHAEKLSTIKKPDINLKTKCISGLKVRLTNHTFQGYNQFRYASHVIQ